jgi:uncharacterized membrane protein YdfJ with MMPL/SSD domain
LFEKQTSRELVSPANDKKQRMKKLKPPSIRCFLSFVGRIIWLRPGRSGISVVNGLLALCPVSWRLGGQKIQRRRGRPQVTAVGRRPGFAGPLSSAGLVLLIFCFANMQVFYGDLLLR